MSTANKKKVMWNSRNKLEKAPHEPLYDMEWAASLANRDDGITEKVEHYRLKNDLARHAGRNRGFEIKRNIILHFCFSFYLCQMDARVLDASCFFAIRISQMNRTDMELLDGSVFSGKGLRFSPTKNETRLLNALHLTHEVAEALV